VASALAASDGELGEALVVGELGDDDDDGSAVAGGSVSLPPHAETAANISVPVAQEISPSRFVMRFLFLLQVTEEAG
jgi:hypothetical protein